MVITTGQLFDVGRKLKEKKTKKQKNKVVKLLMRR